MNGQERISQEMCASPSVGSGTVPLVSVVVPVYKVERYLARCLDSIARQTFTGFEAILVDDGSPDSCGGICDDYARRDGRFRVIHQENGGLSAARNAGLRQCRGRFVTFVDSDDCISIDMFAHMLSVQERTRADIVSVSHTTEPTIFFQIELSQNSDRDGTFVDGLHVFAQRDAVRYYLQTLNALKNDEASAWAKLYKKEIFDIVKYPNGVYYEDMVTTLKSIMSCNKYAKSDRVCYYYNQESAGITRGSFTTRDFDLLREADNLCSLVEAYGDEESLSLAKAKRVRCHFTLLAKIALFGVDASVREKEVSGRLLGVLRRNYLRLIRSEMPLNRKIVLTVMCLNWPLARFCIRLGGRGLRKRTQQAAS